MPLRPVDMLTMLPRLTEASRQQHNNETQPAVAQHALAIQRADKAVRDQQSVHQRAPAEQAEIARDGKSPGRGPGRDGQKRRQPEGPSSRDQSPGDPVRGVRLDVRL